MTRQFGLGIVHAMPKVLTLISTIGTAAMLWVGGSIFIHGLEALNWGAIAHFVHDAGAAVGAAIPVASGFFTWATEATFGGIFGLALGLLIVPVVNSLVLPAITALSGQSK